MTLLNRLNYYYSVRSDCFPLLLHFLTLLIKLILCLKFFYRQKAGGGHGGQGVGGRTIGPCSTSNRTQQGSSLPHSGTLLQTLPEDVQVFIFGTCECHLTWKKGLCRWE